MSTTNSSTPSTLSTSSTLSTAHVSGGSRALLDNVILAVEGGDVVQQTEEQTEEQTEAEEQTEDPAIKKLNASLAALSTMDDKQRALSLPQLAKEIGITASKLESLLKSETTSASDGSGGSAGQPSLGLAVEQLEPVDYEVDGAAIAETIHTALTGKVRVQSPIEHDIMVLWTMSSYFYEEFSKFPRLFFHAPDANCGKSTAGDAVLEFVHKGVATEGATPAAIENQFFEEKIILFIDEIFNVLKDNEGTMSTFFKSGYSSKGSRMKNVQMLVDGVQKHVPQAYSTYAPMIVAGVGEFYDPQLATRCMAIKLQRAGRMSVLEKRKLAKDYTQTRRELLTWRDTHLEDFESYLVEPPMFLDTREAENWLPLFGVAQMLGGDWPARCEAASAYLCNPATKQKTPLETLLRLMLREFEENSNSPIPIEDLAHLTEQDYENDWDNIFKKYKQRKTGISKLLGSVDITNTVVSLNKVPTRCWIRDRELEDVFCRYLTDYTPAE